MGNSSPVISDQLANEVITLLERINCSRGYWTGLYWEFQEGATQMFIRISISDSQNIADNIQTVKCICRSVLSPLLPSSDEQCTWCAAILHDGNHVGGVIGGCKDDWKYLGNES